MIPIAAFSYEINYRFYAHHCSLSSVNDLIDRLNHCLGIVLIKRSFNYNSGHRSPADLHRQLGAELRCAGWYVSQGDGFFEAR